MNSYRLVVLLKGDMDKKSKENVLSNIEKWVGAPKEVTLDALGEKKLAYPIKGAQKADYVVMKFKSEPVKPEFLNQLEMQDDILRHLLIRD